MTTTHSANGQHRQRKQLSDQIDRLDGLLEGLSEGLNQAVADAARAGCREAVREVLLELLRDPTVQSLLGQAPVATQEVGDPPTRTTLWSKVKQSAANLASGVAHKATAVWSFLTRSARSTATATVRVIRVAAQRTTSALAAARLVLGITAAAALTFATPARIVAVAAFTWESVRRAAGVVCDWLRGWSPAWLAGA